MASASDKPTPDSPGPRDEASVDRDEAEAAQRTARRRRRLIEVSILLFCPLLLHSCTLSEMKMSVGPAAPIVVIDMDNDDFTPQRVDSFSPIGLAMNIAFAIGLLYVIAIPAARECLLSGSFRYTLWLFVFVSNCVLLCPILPFFAYVWHYGVLQPLSIVLQVVRPAVETIALAVRDPGADPYEHVDIVTFAICSRIYYVIVMVVGTLSPRFGIWFYRHVLQPSPDRWWQFSLRGWFALTAIIGLVVTLVIWMTSNA